jgi:hypothetical protein
MQITRRSWTPVLGLAAAFAVGGCNADGLFGNNTGRIRVVLSGDAGGASASVAADPALSSATDERNDDSRLSHWFDSVKVTLSSVLVRNLDGKLVNVPIALPVTVDVVKIEGGKQVVLPNGTLPAGTYDQVVIVITAVQGTAHDGTVMTIEPPGGGWTAVVPICALEVAEGATSTVGITLNVRSSFLRFGTHWSFLPRFQSRTICAAAKP